MDQRGTIKRFSQEDFNHDDKVAQFNLKWSPILAMFLFSDASMTRNFELIFRSPTKVKILEEIEGVSETTRIDQEFIKEVEGPHVNRKITFLTNDGKILMWAESVWNKEAYEGLMKNKGEAIGTNMKRQKFENFREINFAGIAENDKEVTTSLEMKDDETLLLRNYYFWNGGKRVAVIQEYFSREVKKVLNVE